MSNSFDEQLLIELTRTQEELEQSRVALQDIEAVHRHVIAEKNRKLSILGKRVKTYRAKILELTETCENLRVESNSAAEHLQTLRAGGDDLSSGVGSKA